MASFEAPQVLRFRNNWYRGHARLMGRNVLINHVSSRSAQAMGVATREGAMVAIPVCHPGSAATELCELIVKEGGSAS
jgi:hypothetical protein